MSNEATYPVGAALREKEQHLAADLEHLAGGAHGNGKLAIAFSGGVDSTFLLAFAHDLLGNRALALTAESPFFPDTESMFANEFCTEHGIEHHRIPIDVLDHPTIASNPPDRCYHCKHLIFTSLMEAVRGLGCAAVADGTNADDSYDDRPGMRALTELGVASPLRDAGLTKADIRTLSHELQLPTSDKPSFACLATRIPHGAAITEPTLRAVEQAEDVLHELGFEQCRVRVQPPALATARIEVLPQRIEDIAREPYRSVIDERLRAIGFEHVAVDLHGYAE